MASAVLASNEDREMYKITVTKKGHVVAVYFNDDADQGGANARMAHPGCRVRVEAAA